MANLQLFRIKIYPTTQPRLWDKELTRSEILRDTIKSLPSAELRKGQIWHIGNLLELDEDGSYFRFGRSAKSMLEVFDDNKGSFGDKQVETAPYTHVFVDSRIEVCAIAAKPRLSQRIEGIARRFARLLNESKYGRELEVRFVVEDIKDPQDLIAYMRKAASIGKFKVTLGPPNPWDIDADYTQPVQRTLNAMSAEKGALELKGEHLDESNLEKIVRSAAAAGENAIAWMKARTGQTTRRELAGKAVKLQQDDLSSPEKQKAVLDNMREKYSKVLRQAEDLSDE